MWNDTKLVMTYYQTHETLESKRKWNFTYIETALDSVKLVRRSIEFLERD